MNQSPPHTHCHPGEGRFGKVYECRNLDTGEMMAVKQMSVQEKDTGTLQTICDEIGIFQRVNHENIVKFLGLEVHHVSMRLVYPLPSPPLCFSPLL